MEWSSTDDAAGPSADVGFLGAAGPFEVHVGMQIKIIEAHLSFSRNMPKEDDKPDRSETKDTVPCGCPFLICNFRIFPYVLTYLIRISG